MSRMEMVWSLVLAGLGLASLTNAITSNTEQRYAPLRKRVNTLTPEASFTSPSRPQEDTTAISPLPAPSTLTISNNRSSLILPAPPWRGSAVLPPSAIYETPTSIPSWEDDADDDEYSTPTPDPYSDETWYPLSTIAQPPAKPSPSYSAIVSVRTTTWTISRSTTITSIVFETYYSTLTDYDGSAEGGTVTVTTTTAVTETESVSASDPCAAATSGSPSAYASECLSSPSGTPVTTITWSPAATVYPLPSSSEDEGRAPVSTSTASSAASTTTTTSTSTTTSTTASPTSTSTADESPPVVTGAAASPLRTNTRALVAAAALFAALA